MLKQLRFVALAIGLLQSPLAWSSASSPPALATTIRVGVTAAPGTTGEVPPAGTNYFVDVMEALAKSAGLTIEYSVLPFAQLLPAIVDGRIDTAATSIGITEERRALGIEFLEPFASWSDGLAVAATDATAYRNLSELAGQNVGTTAGTIYEAAITAAGGILRTYPNQASLIAAVGNGEVKAAVVNIAAARYQVEVAAPDPSVRFVDTYETIFPVVGSAPVRRTDTALLETLNMAVAALRANGTLAELTEHYRYGTP